MMRTLPLAVALWISASLVHSATAADLSISIQTLQTLGKEGIDNQAASRAWAAVAAAEPSQLDQLLAGIDGANPLGANYLRSAIDVVVDRIRASGATPPTALVEAFLKDVSHTPRARRLAFEVLTRFDPQAPERLIPGFVKDPSTELRREAIERLIQQGREQLAAAKDAPAERAAAVSTLQAAFADARDLDQIESLAKELKQLGVTVDLPVHYGFLMNWKLIGPFDNTNESAFDIVYPPEQELRLDANYAGKEGKKLAWIDHTTTDAHGMVDFNKALGKANGVVAYAYCEFESPRAMTVDFRTGCICAFKLWVNGQLVDGRNVYHSGTRVDQYVARGQLKAGKNAILVKVLQNEQTQNWAQDWQFQLRVCDAVGTALLSLDRPAASQP